MIKVIDDLKRILPKINFKNEKRLVDDGILDSLDIISIISELEDKYNIHIASENITPHNFNSIKAMEEMLDEIIKKSEHQGKFDQKNEMIKS